MTARGLAARRAVGAVIGLSMVAAGVPLSAEPAHGADVNVLDRPANAVTADALPTAQINGVVWDLAVVGDYVFAGGQFSAARPAGAAPGVNTVARGNLLSFNIRTGVLTGWAPGANGIVRRLAVSPDRTRLYVAGDFTAVNGQPRSRVAAFDVSAQNGSGPLTGGFAPVVGAPVYGLAATDSTVYLGGFFNSVNGVPRAGLAAVSAASGATTGWVAEASGGLPRSLALTADRSRLLVAGQFSSINQTSVRGMGSIDTVTGQVRPLAANAIVYGYGTKAGFYSVRTDASNAYFTAWKYGGTGNFEGMVVTDPNTGALKSMVDCHGDTYDVSPMNTSVYTVSHHHHCANIGGFPDTSPRTRWQRANGFTLAPTSTVRTNNQSGYANFAGQPAPSLLSWFPDVSAGSFTGQYQGGWTTAATTEYLVQGGEFPAVNNQPQQGLVRFAVPSLAPRKQGMRATPAESAPSLQAVTDDSVRLTWLANYDRDDQRLLYRVYRNGALVTTTTAVSQFWNRPTLTFTDTGLAPGSYTYTILAADADGNSQASDSRSITLAGGAPPSPAIAADTFTRSGSGWGPAELGGGWTTSGTNFATTGSAGRITVSPGSGPWASLDTVSVPDTVSTVSFSTDKVANGGGAQIMLTARKASASEYQLRALIGATGAVSLSVVAVVNGTQTTVGSVPISGLRYTAGEVLKLKFTVTGSGPTMLAGKVWRASAAEPSSAQISVGNAAAELQGTGAIGVRTYLSGGATNGPLAVTFDDYDSTRPA